VFVSILVHELGHAFTMRYFGQDARVVLYMMGGLAIPESSPWRASSGRRVRGPLSQILISAAGPGAGFLLAGLVRRSSSRRGLVAAPLGPWFLPIPVVTLPEAANEQWYDVVESFCSGSTSSGPDEPRARLSVGRRPDRAGLLVAKDPWEGVVNRCGCRSLSAGGCRRRLVVLNDRFLGILFGLLAFSNSWQFRTCAVGCGEAG